MGQGMAASRADHRAVDRASGARGRGAQAIAIVVGQRRNERRGYRRVRAPAGTQRRRCGAPSASGSALLPAPLAAIRLGFVMSRLLSPPAAIELTLAADGSPAFVSGVISGAI